MIMPTGLHGQKDLSGISTLGEVDALLNALLAGLHSLSTSPIGQEIHFITSHDGLCNILQYGYARWASHEWRRQAGIESLNSPAWRKLAKAAKRFCINVRRPLLQDEFELLGRTQYYAQCALGSSKVYKLYTDGSFFPKLMAGGWAAIIEDGKASSALSGSMDCLDCNQAELTAVNKGLEAFQNNESVIIFTDSQCVVIGFRTIDMWMDCNWRTVERKKVMHRGLWEQLYQHAQRLSIRFEWIKGHSGIEQNYKADLLAKREAKNHHKKRRMELSATAETQNHLFQSQS